MKDVKSTGEVVPMTTLIMASDWVQREALVAVFGGSPEIDVAGEAASVAELIRLARATTPTLILVNLSGTSSVGGSPLSVAREIRTALPAQRLILLFEAPTVDVRFFLDMRLNGILCREDFASGEELVAAVLSVAPGFLVISPAFSDRALARSAAVDRYRLVRREVEVLTLLGRGLSNKEIATQTRFAHQTVKNVVASLFRKLDVHNRYEAARIARGLLPLDDVANEPRDEAPRPRW